MFTLETILNTPEAKSALAHPANVVPPDIATASVFATLTALHVNADNGLTHAEVDIRRNKISRTILKAALVAVAYVVTGKFAVSALAMRLLTIMTDFAKISLATDNVRPSSGRSV